MGSVQFLLATALLVVLSNYNSFTTAVTLAPVSKCVYLKNLFYDEYLYTSTDNAVDPSTNHVFTWRRKTDGSAKEWKKSWGKEYKFQGVWLFEKKVSACLECYTIKSAFYKDAGPLYSISNAERDAKKSPARWVYTFRGREAFPAQRGEDIWEVVVIPGFIGSVRIRNKNFGETESEYLYAGYDEQAYDADRRNVYTLSAKANSTNNNWNEATVWVMTDSKCPPYEL